MKKVWIAAALLAAAFCAGCAERTATGGDRAPRGEVLFDWHGQAEGYPPASIHGTQSVRKRHMPARLPRQADVWEACPDGGTVLVVQPQ